MYTIRETPGEKPGLVRMARRFRGTWCFHNQSSALISVTVLAVKFSNLTCIQDCMNQEVIYADHFWRVYSCEVLMEFLLW